MLERLFCALQSITPQRTLTFIAGKLANSKNSFLKYVLISSFSKVYSIDLSEAEYKSISDYESFNEFFTRKLDGSARVFTEDTRALVSPADGTVSQIGTIDNGRIIQAKGRTYSLDDLLAGEEALVDSLQDGHWATIYLAPSDYHRVHMPVDATLIRTIYVPGRLFSVNEATTRQVPNLFAQNERLICEFESEIGKFAMVLVGAMIVAGIETTWQKETFRGDHISSQKFDPNEIQLAQGEEMGLFRMGSTVIVIAPSNEIRWRSDLKEGSKIRVGEIIATRPNEISR